jgi:hypothetical protein
MLDALAVLRHHVAGEERLQHLRDVLRGQSERAGAILVDFEADRLDLFVPVQVRIEDVGVFRHHGAHLLGDAANLQGIGTNEAELNGEADRRAEREAVDPRPRLRYCAVRQGAFEPGLHALARLEVFRHDDDLGEARVRADGGGGHFVTL